jgi:hypothetical protein
MMMNKSKQLDWLEKERNKDKNELENEKSKFIQEIKKLKKEEIIPVPLKKLTLWQRIKKVLMS